jgi:hypothetical protein
MKVLIDNEIYSVGKSYWREEDFNTKIRWVELYRELPSMSMFFPFKIFFEKVANGEFAIVEG